MEKIPSLITKKEAARILFLAKPKVEISLDLGVTKSEIMIMGKVAHFPNGSKIPFSQLLRLKDGAVYFIEKDQLKQVATFSEESNLHYKLIPTADWPTIALSSTPMHRHTRITPKVHAERMIVQISPVKGRVLDTCCGLGYTAILASKDAEKVLTYDIDPVVQEIAKFNPYSHDLFTKKNILLTHEDIFEAIQRMKDESFDRIVHDPPTPALAPDLYQQDFHKELFRVLRKGGILYHYCPRPKVTHGEILYPRIKAQLEKAGFKEVEYKEESSGIRAVK
ncbi:MAG TPA: methyltransferase domain-containing protein [Candidatus Nanoarchaeia archaeon]|nr:methyltransferase domain-containing protein [Candidatus Nanoarchaeia archaeon]